MPPNRFRREKREVTPFNDEPVVPEEIPAEWRHVEAPPNFTWVGMDELAGMGWPKSRDQVRFLVDQGIDHLVTLSADKIPPHYAFPELKWSLIPVEDFHGPAMSEIRKFINIMDDARRNGEAVGVHCAEGRGRTGVMCACYLIYYHDLKPWDAIRIMRRQRPGSVERKTQENTVVRFYHVLQDYGKSALEDLEKKEKEWKENQRRRRDQNNLLNCENKLLSHTASFYGTQRPETKIQRLERIQRMRRSKSMPKMTQEMDESEKLEINFKQHLQNFYGERNRSRSQARDGGEFSSSKEEAASFSRATTPGRSLVEGLKKTTRKSEAREIIEKKKQENEPSDFRKHFKDFLAGNANSKVKRVRSFSQPKENKNNNNNTVERKEDTSKDSDEILTDNNKDKIINVTENCTQKSNNTKDKVSRHDKEINIVVTQSKANSKQIEDDDDDDVDTDDSYSQSRSQTPTSESDKNKHSYDESDESEKNSTRADTSSESDSEVNENKSSSSLSSSSTASMTSLSDASNNQRPPQPNYRPKYTLENSSSTYSYYTRVRSRAKAKAEASSVSGNDNLDKPSVLVDSDKENELDKELNKNSTSDKNKNRVKRFTNNRNSNLYNSDPLRRRAKTVDRDMCVTVTLNESQNSANVNHRYLYKYRHSNSNEPLIYPSHSNFNDNDESRYKRSYSLSNEKRQINTSRNLNEIHHHGNLTDNQHNSRNHGSFFIQTADAFTSPASSLSSYRVRSRLRNNKSVYDISSTTSTTFSSHHGSLSSAAIHSPFSRDNWKRVNHRFKYNKYMTSMSKETYV